jgi:hypothetical protein
MSLLPTCAGDAGLDLRWALGGLWLMAASLGTTAEEEHGCAERGSVIWRRRRDCSPGNRWARRECGEGIHGCVAAKSTGSWCGCREKPAGVEREARAWAWSIRAEELQLGASGVQSRRRLWSMVIDCDELLWCCCCNKNLQVRWWQFERHKGRSGDAMVKLNCDNCCCWWVVVFGCWLWVVYDWVGIAGMVAWACLIMQVVNWEWTERCSYSRDCSMENKENWGRTEEDREKRDKKKNQ